MSAKNLFSRMASAAALGSCLVLSACNADGSLGPQSAGAATASNGASPAADGQTGPLAGRKWATDVLIYDGVAAAYNDADSLEEIAASHGLSVDRADSDDFNAMSPDKLASYGMILWPGGYATQQSESLTPETRSKIRDAVINKGVSFMGICAGAWMAIGPTPKTDPEWGLAIVPGEIMEEWLPNGEDGIEMTPVAIAGQSQPRDIVWWGGPALPEWQGGVIARYKDGTPAMSQTWAGHGFVVLTSPHPEAPQVWRDKYGLNDSDGTDFEQAFALMKAALDQKPLPTQ